MNVSSLLRRIAVLKGRGEYRSAVSLLSKALRRKIVGGTRESLSYELGTLLTRHGGSKARACRHWRRHERRYRSGRHAREIARAKARLGCD